MELGVTAVMLPELDFEEQVELCRSLGLKYYQYRPRVIDEDERTQPYSNWDNHKFDLTPDRLVDEGRSLTNRLRQAGLEPYGTLPELWIDMPADEIKRHLEGAAVAEAKWVRCKPPEYPKGPFDYAELLGRTIDLYSDVIEKLSAPMGIRLLIETHAKTIATAPGLAWNICRNFSAENIGVIFDLPNFTKEGEVKPNLAVSVLKDYIGCVHIGGGRRVITAVDVLGSKVVGHQWCSLEESDLHAPTWLKVLAAAGVQAPLIIEDFTPNMKGAERLKRSSTFLHKVLETLRI